MITSDYNYLKEPIEDYLGDKLNWKDFSNKYSNNEYKLTIKNNTFRIFYFTISSYNVNQQIEGKISKHYIPEWIELKSGTKFYRYDKV